MVNGDLSLTGWLTDHIAALGAGGSSAAGAQVASFSSAVAGSIIVSVSSIIAAISCAARTEVDDRRCAGRASVPSPSKCPASPNWSRPGAVHPRHHRHDLTPGVLARRLRAQGGPGVGGSLRREAPCGGAA